MDRTLHHEAADNAPRVRPELMLSGPTIAARFGRRAETLEGADRAAAAALVAFYLAAGVRALVYALAPERIVVGAVCPPSLGRSTPPGPISRCSSPIIPVCRSTGWTASSPRPRSAAWPVQRERSSSPRERPQHESSTMGTFLAYSGSYHLDGSDVIHEEAISLYPNWVGGHAALSEDGRTLTLSTDPIVAGGRPSVQRLLWRRVLG